MRRVPVIANEPLTVDDLRAFVGVQCEGWKIVGWQIDAKGAQFLIEGPPAPVRWFRDCPHCGRPLVEDPDGGPGYPTERHLTPEDYERCRG